MAVKIATPKAQKIKGGWLVDGAIGVERYYGCTKKAAIDKYKDTAEQAFGHLGSVETLYLADGTSETIFNADQFERLIGERLGSDAERYFRELVNEMTDEQEIILRENAIPLEDVQKFYDELREVRKELSGIYEILDKFSTKGGNTGEAFRIVRDNLGDTKSKMYEAMKEIHGKYEIDFMEA